MDYFTTLLSFGYAFAYIALTLGLICSIGFLPDCLAASTATSGLRVYFLRCFTLDRYDALYFLSIISTLPNSKAKVKGNFTKDKIAKVFGVPSYYLKTGKKDKGIPVIANISAGDGINAASCDQYTAQIGAGSWFTSKS